MVQESLSFAIYDPSQNAIEYHQVGCRQFLIGLDGQVYDGHGNPYDENLRVLRCTGYKTYLDDDIFEGDIIEFYLGTGFAQRGPFQAVVLFKDGAWHFCDDSLSPQPAWQIEDMTVIGNILTTPELFPKIRYE